MLTLLFAFAVAMPQDTVTLSPSPADDAPATAGALRVFLDCGHACDFDFLRTDITWVSYVRDRRDADVHVLVTTERSGSGGRVYTLALLGQRSVEKRGDTLTFATRPTDTEVDIRRVLSARLQLGLVRFAVRTPLAGRLRLRLDGEAPTTEPAGGDPWNLWVFRIGLNGGVRGEASSSARSLNASASANRTTDAWRIRMALEGRSNRDRYDTDDTTSVINRSHFSRAEAFVVRSVGARVSVGAIATASSSSFVNQELWLRFAPAVEVNLFPYTESTRRELRVSYWIGVERVRYEEVTLYGKLRETLFSHTLNAEFDTRQPWGSAGVSASGSQYLHDGSKLRLNFSADADIRLVRGLSLSVRGNYAVIRNQLFLPSGEASAEEVLLQRRQLATGYRYSSSVGLSYTFGSVFNNVVNPRFGG